MGQILMLYTAVTVGAPAAVITTRLTAAAAATDSRWAHAMAAHVAALAGSDGAALDAAAAALGDIGAWLHAAHAADAASAAHGVAGRRSSAVTSAGRRDAWLERCAGAQLGTVRSTPSAHLSRREREVAGLAARGWSNAHIADRLHLSVRTVESHVYRASTKLGVTRRRDLAAALDGEPSD
jgi:DNA-binding NarL/FixJ family response regulator